MPSLSPSPSIQIVPYDPSTHVSLLPSIADLHMTTVITDNIVMRFHPPFTPSKRQLVLDFWTERLDADSIEGAERVTLLALSTQSTHPSNDAPDEAPSSTSAPSTTAPKLTSVLPTPPTPTLAGLVQLHTPTNALDTGPFRAELELLMIHPQYRRYGLASRLVRDVEKVALGKGRTQVTLSTTRGTLAEEVFYPRCGYKVFGVLGGYALQPYWVEDKEGAIGEGGEGDAVGVEGLGGEGGGGRWEKRRVDGVYFYKNLDEEVGKGEK